MDREAALSAQLQKLSLPVSVEVGRSLLQYLDELFRWNRRHNLTAITDPLDAVEKHLVDSLTVLPMLTGVGRLLDIGSGGGFPALPLKIAQPSLAVVSVDAVAKKIMFQRHVARMLSLKGFEALHARVEALSKCPEYSAEFEVVISRAFAALPSFAAMALPFLAPGGKIIAMKGAEAEKELEEASQALADFGLVCVERRHLKLPASDAQRCLLVLQRR